MSGPWEKYKREATPDAAGPWNRYRRGNPDPVEEPTKGDWSTIHNPVAAMANDAVIEVANAALGGVGAVADFVVPGNRVSRAIDDFVKYGEEKQSDAVQADREKFRNALGQSEGISDDLAAVGEYLTDSPLQAAAQAVGSFAVPAGAIRAGRAAAGMAGLGARGATAAARGAGISAGAALGGGDAAGSAYDLVQEIPNEQLLQHADAQAMLAEGKTVAEIRDALGTRAARDASILPALAGAAAGAFGAEKLLAGGRATQGGLRGALGTGAVEGLTEAAEEGLTQYEGRSAAQEYDPSIDPTKNVAAMAAMGGVQGGALGGALGAVPRRGMQVAGAEAQDSIEQRYGDLARERAAEHQGEGDARSKREQAQARVQAELDAADSPALRARNLTVVEAIEPGDVMHASGKAFVTASAARQRAAELGDGAEVLRYGNGFIVRPGTGGDIQLNATGPADTAASAASDGTTLTEAASAGEGLAGRFKPRQQVYLRQNGRELPVEYLGVERNAAVARAGGDRLARIRTADGRGHFVRLADLSDQPMPANTPDRQENLSPQLEAPTAPVLQVDRDGVAATVRQRTAEAARRSNLGLTPDVEAAAANHPATRDASDAAPAAAPIVPDPLALPAPSLSVNAAGQAGSPTQHRAEAQRRADLGLTPDVVAAAERHPGASTDAAAHEAATSPTNRLSEPSAAQKEAGNYKVGRARVAGLDISIENPEGSERRGTSPDGTAWANRMAGHYGYIRRTEGADGDQVDVFVRPGTAPEFSGPVFVVDQVDPSSGSFDESKVMLGYDSREQAEGAYRDSYTPEWRGMGKVVEMDVPTFKRWLAEGDTTRPAADSGMGVVVREPDITAKSGRSFLTRGAAQRAATAHGNADVARVEGGFVARPLTGQSPREVPAPSAADFARDARRDFLQMLRQAGGIRPELAADIYGDRANLANRRAPGLFRRGGMDVDRLVEAMQQSGYLPMEADTVGLAGTAMDRVREALEGEAVYTLEQMDEAARRAYAEREAERFDNPNKSKAQIAVDLFDVIDAMDPETTAAELAAQFDAAAYLYQQGITNGRAQEDLIERAAIQAEESPAAFVDAVKSAAAAYGRGDDVNSGRGGAGEFAGNAGAGAASDSQGGAQALTLESPTSEGLRAAAEQQAAQQQEASVKAREADQRAEADAARNDFVLTGSDRAADQAAARGQQELTSPPESPAVATPDAGAQIAPAAPAARPSERIEDFGETLHGARKHYAEQYAERLRQAETLPIRDYVLAETWPEPNYAKLLEDGADPLLVALVHASRDEVPNKPRTGWRLKGWADQVKTLREFSGELLGGGIKGSDVRAILEKSRDLRDVYGRARLYEAVGHDRSLRGVALRSGQYGIFAGEKFDTPRTIWTVERKASAGLGNWPEILANGESADAAIAEFKRAAAEQENQATPREVRFDIYARSRMPGFYIGKKVGRVQVDLKHFDDIKAARAYLADNREELVRRLDELKAVPAHRRESNSPRVGTDHRDGGDVTPTQFADAFGFRGVQFGNYVEGGRRQADLNEAFDALMDLAGVIGVPARALSLNGELGLAFGARGIGGRDAALAHYEPGQVVINLTKKRGAGSLAHEWWHGLDNYFSRRGGAPAGYASESGRSTVGIRPSMAEAFGALKQTIGLIGMRERSRKLDERKAKDYWSTGRELSARAFESYVIAKLADQGAANDYLANVVEEKAFRDEQSYPYPTAAEIAPVRAAFDRFFQTVEQVPGEDGRIALESRGEGDSGLELTDARRLADDFMGKLPGAATLRVSVVKSVDQIPEGAKPSALAEGAYYPARDGGRIYLVAENLPTAERLEQVLAHEVVGHFGVEALLGDRFREVLVDVRRLARAPDGAHIPKNAGPEHPHYATFEAVTARYPDYSAENRAREVLARMAEQGKRTIFLERLYGKIRAALRRLGLNLKLTNAEIRQMVVDAGRFLQRAPAARVSAGMQEAAASMAASRAADSGGAAVTVLTGQELGSPELGAKELRDAARAWAAENLKGKDFVNRATGWRVQVSQRGIKESLSRSARISKIQSMAALPGLIEQAILGHTEPNRNKQRDPFTSQVHTLYAPVEIGGQDYLARLVVKESANGHLFYDHDLSDVVEAKRPDNTSAVSTPATKAGADRTPSGRAFTVEEIGEIVNREGRAGWVFDPGPLESRGEAATADAPPIQPGAPRNPRRGAKIERPGEVLSDIERRRRNMFLGKIGAWAEQAPIKERLAKVSDRWQARLVQGIFDQFAPLKAINPTAYMQARLSKGADGAAEYLVRHGPVKLEDGALDTADGKGLADILAGLAGEHDHFMAWIAANRAERLAAEWQVRYDNGVTERFADEAAARAEAAKWPGAKAEAASRERLFTAEDIEVGKGLARGKMADGRNRAQVYADALAGFNKLQRSVLDVAEGAGLIDSGSRKLWESEFYVPFYRVMEDDNSGAMGPGQIGGLVGQQAYKRLKGGTDKLGDLVANTVSNWSHLLSAGMKNLAAQGALLEAVRLGVATPARAGERGSVRAMFDGRERHFMVSDPLVMNALTSLHYVGSNDPFTKAARKFKHALTVGVTISPTFRVRNLIRDTVQAMAIDSSLSVNPVRNMVEGWKATGSSSDTWRRLMAGGGAVRFGSFNDGNARNVKRLVDELGAHPDEVVASPAGLRRAMRKAFDWYQETGDRSETINRAAIYQQARKAGRSHLEASYAARDLMDFTAGGTFAAVRLLSQVVPFFNARLQGMYKLGRGAVENPARFAAVSGAVAMASALLYLGMKDDDDYKQLPDWARNTYWITKLPGTDRFVYIPKPFEVGALGSVVERGTEMAFGGDDFQLGDFGKSVASILAEQLSMDPTPQLIKPAMEAAFNYDRFRDRAIDSVGQERLPAGERFTASTSAGAVALGRALNVSPQRLEHLVRGYFGWLGTQALNVTDYAARPLSGLPENPRRDLSRLDNWFVVGDFVKDADPRSSKYIQRFYDEQRDINEVYAAYMQARQLGDIDRAQDLAADESLQLRGLFQAADKQMRQIRLQIKALERAPIPPEEKRARLDELYAARSRLAMLADQRVRAARP